MRQDISWQIEMGSDTPIHFETHVSWPFHFLRLTCWGLGKKNHGMINVGQLVLGFLAKDQLVKENDGGPQLRRERKRV